MPTQMLGGGAVVIPDVAGALVELSSCVPVVMMMICVNTRLLHELLVKHDGLFYYYLVRGVYF